MGFYNKLLKQYELNRHDGRPLWKYEITDEDFQELITELQFSDEMTLDSKDACLYYALWWKKEYSGGKPSKEEVFHSIGGNIQFNLTAEEFYRNARKGAQILGIRWIKKQNKLYFRTLLLQGGLPLKHIRENESVYFNFLSLVLEKDIDNIQEIQNDHELINRLPTSCRNEDIFENCLEIVRSIRNGDSSYDVLFETDKTVKNITDKLKIKKQELNHKKRTRKPQTYWVLDFYNENASISLDIGFNDTSYSPDALINIFGFEPIERQYQFFINDELIGIFRRLVNGKYKMDWDSNLNLKWDEDSGLPVTYVIAGDGERKNINGFIQVVPDLDRPTLWMKLEDKKWRLVKGNNASLKEAAILMPKRWCGTGQANTVDLYNNKLDWLEFQGEIEIVREDGYKQRFLSEVESFDWTIAMDLPKWMNKANMPVVTRKPIIDIFDENNKKLSVKDYSLYIKRRNGLSGWELLSNVKALPVGCVELKIEKNGLIAYDTFFNIGDLSVRFENRQAHEAEVCVNTDRFDHFRLDESPILDMKKDKNKFYLQINAQALKIPILVNGSVGMSNQRKLTFSMDTPFVGMFLIDKEGRKISENEKLFFKNLNGLRILSRMDRDMTITFWNPLKDAVKISKEINETAQSLKSFKEEISKLFYLADVMNYENEVCMQLKSGTHRKNYQVAQFTHILNTDKQFDGYVSIDDSEEEFELYAVPVSVNNRIEPIPLTCENDVYKIPANIKEKQFVVVSSPEKERQLMPRFVNLDDEYVGLGKNERIRKYYQELKENRFESSAWKNLLAYFRICDEYEIPFSTFDQIRALSTSSITASKAFLFLGVNQYDMESYIQNTIPEFEKDLGVCFHWCRKNDWQNAIDKVMEFLNQQYYGKVIKLLANYFNENNLSQAFGLISNGEEIDIESIYNKDVLELRSKLSQRVLKELPRHSPKIKRDYGVPILQNEKIRLLLQSPIVVAESIMDIPKDYPIWGEDDFRESIRRNIQYAQYISQDLDSDFYSRILLHALKEMN